jgi:hypothetical protein
MLVEAQAIKVLFLFVELSCVCVGLFSDGVLEQGAAAQRARSAGSATSRWMRTGKIFRIRTSVGKPFDDA